MVIGLDIDGTITRHPEFFAFLSQMLVAGGHQVIVITFREDRNNAVADLAAWNIRYSELLMWSFQDYGDEDMYAWKGRMCAVMNVAILFDDDPQVHQRLDPQVISMMVVNHHDYNLARLTEDTAAAIRK